MALPVANQEVPDWLRGENDMCDECKNDLLNDGMSEDDANDFMALLSALFGDQQESEPITSFLEERGLTPEFTLAGELYGKPWLVKVAEIPLDQIEEENRGHGSQWWAMDGFYDGELVRSSEGAPPEPVTAEIAAKTYAEFHFDFVF